MTVFKAQKTKRRRHKNLMEKFEGILVKNVRKKKKLEKIETKTKSENLKK